MGGGGSRRSSAGAGSLSAVEVSGLQHDLEEITAENAKLTERLKAEEDKASKVRKTSLEDHCEGLTDMDCHLHSQYHRPLPYRPFA